MDNINCFGKFSAGRVDCRCCDYSQSCELFTHTEPAMNRPIGGQDYDAVAEWAPDLADYDHIPGDHMDSESSKSTGEVDLASTEALGTLLRYLLGLDDYTIGILAEIIAPTRQSADRLTAAGLSRLHHCSRQGMHRKLLDTVQQHPELRGILKCVLLKVRRSRIDFSAGDRRRENRAGIVQMELF